MSKGFEQTINFGHYVDNRVCIQIICHFASSPWEWVQSTNPQKFLTAHSSDASYSASKCQNRNYNLAYNFVHIRAAKMILVGLVPQFRVEKPVSENTVCHTQNQNKGYFLIKRFNSTFHYEKICSVKNVKICLKKHIRNKNFRKIFWKIQILIKCWQILVKILPSQTNVIFGIMSENPSSENLNLQLKKPVVM